ncbi:MAG: porphobilinogen synthase [Rhodospirillaceae bacterium]|nr:porphobilinogen synthase [Rhodospirillaceae bacterium]
MSRSGDSHAAYPATRLRRTRQAPWIRRLVREATLQPADLVLPLFLIEGNAHREPVGTLPGIDRLSIDLAVKTAAQAAELGIPAIALFTAVESVLKTEDGAEAYNPNSLVCRAIRTIKAAVPDIGVICDVALDPYTSHGHDGLLRAGKVINDETVAVLVKQALTLAEAGCDIVAPSDMMDGRVGAIRAALEARGFIDTLILSYAAKYASCFYGPFRDAVGSSRALGGADKSTYQMDPANAAEALREVDLDIIEGADMVMVKPGLPYLDVIRDLSRSFDVPVFAYQVSGEYAMLSLGAENGLFDRTTAFMESLLAFKRAGARGIFTYAAIDIATALTEPS